MMTRTDRGRELAIAGAAAFGAYFCMYAFRKPFTAGTFEGQQVLGLGLKSVLVVAQLIGYMLSKFLGIWLVSGAVRDRRGAAILVLIGFAELALIGFAFAPPSVQVACLFLNGLPLGMVFGLVVSYVEGRRHTEALTAALSASFIVSSGVVKSIGRWMIQELGVTESHMPMLVGLLFVPALLASIWLLSRTPPPDEEDLKHRQDRPVMDGAARARFLAVYGPGLAMLIFIYAVLTVIRTIRDDFGVEIWRELGVDREPLIFARTETVVAVAATGLNALAFLIPDNRTALRATLGLTAVSFLFVAISAFAVAANALSPFGFMAACGFGLYLPYAAFHTTVFERLIAAARVPCNLPFLMYLADSLGYLLYAVVIMGRTWLAESGPILPFFQKALLIGSGAAVVAVGGTALFFERSLRCRPDEVDSRLDVAPEGAS